MSVDARKAVAASTPASLAELPLLALLPLVLLLALLLLALVELSLVVLVEAEVDAEALVEELSLWLLWLVCEALLCELLSDELEVPVDPLLCEELVAAHVALTHDSPFSHKMPSQHGCPTRPHAGEPSAPPSPPPAPLKPLRLAQLVTSTPTMNAPSPLSGRMIP